jgi:hypothetical protein
MTVAKGGFCGKFAKPSERAELHPYCGRLSVTKNCAPPPSEEAGAVQTVPEAPVAASGGQQPSTTTAPAPIPIPDTAVLAGPPPETAARSAVFKFASQGAKSKGYQCSIDGGPFAGCSSPATFSRLAPGQHVFSVSALSPAGDRDKSPAAYHWTVFEDLVPQSGQQQVQPKPKPKPQPQPKPTPKPTPESSPPILVG